MGSSLWPIQTANPPFNKPDSCQSCPLYGNGKGFGFPEVGGTNGVMVVVEALGEQEALQGFPLRGPAGTQFDHILKRAGIPRTDFLGIDNVLHCRPPGNKLAGMPYEFQAIKHCSPFLDDTVQQLQPKAIIAMGAIPLKRMAGITGGITRNRGFIYDGVHNIPVIGTFHPSFLLPRKKEKSSAKYTWVVIMDIRKALRVAKGERDLIPQHYLMDPSLDVAKQFIGEYERTPETTKLAWDLETLYKIKTRNEQKLKLEDKQIITRVNFAFRPGYAMTVPHEEPFISQVIRPLMRFNRPKAGWNCPLPHERVLTADLRWVEAGSLKVGDRLIGFDESPRKGFRARRYRTTTVTHAGRGHAQAAYRVTFSDGSHVEVTGEHPWLQVSANSHVGGRRTHWVKTVDLKRGSRITRLLPTWESIERYENGYLSGLFDGEGHLYHPDNGRIQVAFSQKRGLVLEKGKTALRRLGLRFSEKQTTGVRTVLMTNGDGVRLLGMVRPIRLLKKFRPTMLGSTYATSMPILTIRAVEYIGEHEIVRLSTTTHTYLLEGFGAHNSHGFDEPIVLFQEGWDIGGTLLDGMDQFHVFQPNVERNLEFVTSLMSDHLKPWKHLNQSDLPFYGCVDADATITNVLRLDDIMSRIPIPEYADVPMAA